MLWDFCCCCDSVPLSYLFEGYLLTDLMVTLVCVLIQAAYDDLHEQEEATLEAAAQLIALGKHKYSNCI